MRILLTVPVVLALGLLAPVAARAQAATTPASPYHEVTYPPSTEQGGLAFGVSYTLWVPPGVKTLRSVIVHQHGCGEGACKGGETAAFDLHWQALARKWESALLGPSYQQPEKAECRLWCDPRKGSERAFLRALTDLAAKSGHPELDRLPWVLWGHSGGANWAGIMLMLHPERVVAVWLRSGSPRLLSSDATAGALPTPAAAYQVPVMCNVGIKEKEGRFAGIWTSTLPFFQDFRAHGGLIALATDPRTGHECGDSRYLAIPFLDACMQQRLPEPGSGTFTLRPMNEKAAWVAPPLGGPARPVRSFKGPLAQNGWLPGEAVARAWSDYVKTGSTRDATPPPAPFDVRVDADGELTWQAEADLESGMGGFIIERDGKVLARLPPKPVGRFGRPLFQTMSYHDTPERPLPDMRYKDDGAQPGRRHRYRVRALNSVGLRSRASGVAVAPTLPER